MPLLLHFVACGRTFLTLPYKFHPINIQNLCFQWLISLTIRLLLHGASQFETYARNYASNLPDTFSNRTASKKMLRCTLLCRLHAVRLRAYERLQEPLSYSTKSLTQQPT